MIWRIHLTTVCLSIALVGCVTTQLPQPDAAAVKTEQAAQHALEFNSLLRNQQRLDSIAYPVLNGARDFCGSDIIASTGLRVATRQSFRKALREAAEQEAGLDDTLQVLWTIADSAAQRHGIVAGDTILAINGQKLAEGRRGLRQYRRTLRAATDSDDAINMTVQRDGQSQHYTFIPDRICDYPTRIRLSPVPNAYADGINIVVESGLLALFPQDKDVAFIVSHELAHNIKAHPLKGTASGLFRITADLILGATGLSKLTGLKFTPALEAEADYVGLYIAATAGVDISEADQVWRTFAAATSRAKQRRLIDTHPPTPERYVAIRETIKEIAAKRAAGLPLTPNQ